MCSWRSTTIRAFISASAIGSIAAHAATAVFSLVYIVLAQRHGLAVSVVGAVAVWFIVALLLRSVSWTFVSVAAVNLALFGVCIALTNRYRHVKMPLIVRKWYDIPRARLHGGVPRRRGGGLERPCRADHDRPARGLSDRDDEPDADLPCRASAGRRPRR